MQGVVTHRIVAAVALAAVAALSAGCNRGDEARSAGERRDLAVAQADAQADRSTAEVRGTGWQSSASPRDMGGTAHDAMDKVKDATITSAVNAELVADPRLSGLRVDVDTVDGRVLLSGQAPDVASKAQAGALAASVDGVVSVDNQLIVAGRGDDRK